MRFVLNKEKIILDLYRWIHVFDARQKVRVLGFIVGILVLQCISGRSLGDRSNSRRSLMMGTESDSHCGIAPVVTFLIH